MSNDGSGTPPAGPVPPAETFETTETTETFESGPGRFRALVEGREVAVLDFRVVDGRWDLVHTHAEPAARGTGIASRLVRFALDRARVEGVQIIPSCPYLPVWLDRHPTYQDLVAS